MTDDDTINIAEKAAGFDIAGTGTAGASVTVTLGGTVRGTATADNDGAWSVSVPANAAYISGASVALEVRASKSGFTDATAVSRALTIDLEAPTASYTAPSALKVDQAITLDPSTTDTDIDGYALAGSTLPPGLALDTASGRIDGAPTAASAAAHTTTVTVTDTAGNPGEVAIAFPAVAKGDQTLTGFAYSPADITYGDPAPTLTAPTGAQGALSYASDTPAVCTVDPGSGALTIVAAGTCTVRATAAATPDYAEASDTFTVTVQAASSQSAVSSLRITSTPANGSYYVAGESIVVTVTFVGDVSLENEAQAPPGWRVKLQIGTATRNANWVSGSASGPTGRFSYQVTAADRDADGVAIPADGLRLVPRSTFVHIAGFRNGAVLRDPDHLAHAAVSDNPAHKVGAQAQDTLALTVSAVAGDNTINITEKAAGFDIAGTGTAGALVTVTLGGTVRGTATADNDSAWSFAVPANAAYIGGPSVTLEVSASKAGFTDAAPVSRTLAVDLAAPTASYTAPAALKVDQAITPLAPATTDTDIAVYALKTGSTLPPGLTLDTGSGRISGAPTAASAAAHTTTVAFTDEAGNPGEADIAFRRWTRGIRR